jgi:hypothetical protein
LLREQASGLLREHRRIIESAAEHAKQLQAAMPDDLLMAPLRRHVDGIIADLRDLWRHGDEWEAEADRLARHLADAS